MNEGMNDATSAMRQHASPQGHSTYVLSTDKERFGSTQRHGWHRAWAWSWGVLSLLTLLSTSPAWAQETVCARVKIEIKQELTLERQAFDAEMKINNTTDTGYIPPPRGPLPGFPGSRRNGHTADRARWDLPDGDFCLWDSAHGRVERHNKRGKHQGEYDANTGEQTKPRKPNYDLDKGDF